MAASLKGLLQHLHRSRAASPFAAPAGDCSYRPASGSARESLSQPELFRHRQKQRETSAQTASGFADERIALSLPYLTSLPLPPCPESLLPYESINWAIVRERGRLGWNRRVFHP